MTFDPTDNTGRHIRRGINRLFIQLSKDDLEKTTDDEKISRQKERQERKRLEEEDPLLKLNRRSKEIKKKAESFLDLLLEAKIKRDLRQVMQGDSRKIVNEADTLIMRNRSK